MDEHSAERGERRGAAHAVERELSVLFGRARSFSLSLAAELHPGLDAALYVFLLHLIDVGPVRAAALADRTGLDKSTVSRQVARLVELRLVERVPDPLDGRARIVQLTADGFRLRLEEPAGAVAPGQVAVLYDDDAIVGAGVIVAATG